MNSVGADVEFMRMKAYDFTAFIAATYVLGCLFFCLQVFEYIQATFTIDAGIWGSIFYMLTALHGFHVVCGGM